MNKLDHYPAHHPVALALTGLACALRTGCAVIDALAERAACVGVPFGCETFDDAASLAGVPYSRPLDLYVDRDTKLRADALPFDRLHQAFMH
ncbi:hypothetical protein [Zoogloea sp. 1C4]|uniref:hypothetical protein n=1 Tax=Zoogloea sp. 1C4 TaxID=2570190 RepID=UPI001290AA33|nr:hypothetical protein [Zoogloea sp. 1C4]